MNNVIKFEKKERHAVGEAICMCCKNEWLATAPTGTVQLPCPEYLTYKGHFKFPFSINEGQLIRVCNCGNDLFRLTPEGHMCANCGTYQRY